MHVLYFSKAGVCEEIQEIQIWDRLDCIRVFQFLFCSFQTKYSHQTIFGSRSQTYPLLHPIGLDLAELLLKKIVEEAFKDDLILAFILVETKGCSFASSGNWKTNTWCKQNPKIYSKMKKKILCYQRQTLVLLYIFNGFPILDSWLQILREHCWSQIFIHGISTCSNS